MHQGVGFALRVSAVVGSGQRAAGTGTKGVDSGQWAVGSEWTVGLWTECGQARGGLRLEKELGRLEGELATPQ